jgi:hypothetical protein
MINQYNYYCPKCNDKLDQDSKIVLNLLKINGEKAKIFLDPKPHSYKVNCEPKISFKKNELVEFICPSCNINLASVEYNKFACIILKVTENVIFEVFFSRIYGDHRTFVGIEDFKEEYGDKIKSKD